MLSAPSGAGSTCVAQVMGSVASSGDGRRASYAGSARGGGRAIRGMLALVLGTRPAVSPAMVLAHLEEHFCVAGDLVSVHRTRPNDFIVCFSRAEDLERVLRSPSPPVAPFVLRWQRWSRLIMGSTGAFRFRVLIGMKGIPSYARSMETAQAILGSSSAKVDIANPKALSDSDDERELFVAAWCAHPDLIPDEKIMAVLEPEEEHDGGPPLFLRLHEIIHEVPALRYWVHLRIVEFQDCHTPPPSSDDDMVAGDEEDSDDSNFNGFHPDFGGGGGRGPWPQMTYFGGASDPGLGRGSRPAFRAWETRRAVMAGDVMCPFGAPRGAIPSRQTCSAFPATRGRVSMRPWLRCLTSVAYI